MEAEEGEEAEEDEEGKEAEEAEEDEEDEEDEEGEKDEDITNHENVHHRSITDSTSPKRPVADEEAWSTARNKGSSDESAGRIDRWRDRGRREGRDNDFEDVDPIRNKVGRWLGRRVGGIEDVPWTSSVPLHLLDLVLRLDCRHRGIGFDEVRSDENEN